MFQKDGTNRNTTTVRIDARLNEVQGAIGQYLTAYYEPLQPMPDRLVGLLRKIEQPAWPGGPTQASG
jgi:hypothetical protein